MNSKTFCIAPWIHTCVRSTGQLTPCCQWRGEQQFNFVEFDQWVNSNSLQQTRKSLYAGERIASCINCWTEEDLGKRSLRQIYNSEFSKYFDFKKLNPDGIADNTMATFDFKLGNLCNLKCVMCNGASSSQLMSEYKLNQRAFDLIDFYQTPLINLNFEWPLAKEFKDFLDKFKNQARWIRFTGGEPTIIPYILDLLDEIPDPELVTISLTTNATKINSKLLTCLSKFKTVWISVSLEGIEDANNLIRYPSVWSEIEQNILTLKELPKVYLNINHVLQCFSVVTLVPLLKWCDKHKFNVENVLLTDPEYLKINSVEVELVDRFRAQLKQLQLKNNQNVVNQVVEFLNGYKFDPVLKEQRLKYVTTLDTIRGTDLKNLI